MHGVHVPKRGHLSVVQTPRRKDKQKWHGYTKNGLESIFGSHRGMDIFLFLYLVGVHQGTVTASLPGAFLPGLFRLFDFVLKVMVPLPTTAFQLSPAATPCKTSKTLLSGFPFLLPAKKMFPEIDRLAIIYFDRGRRIA
jgi:hypothetical protein